MEKEQESIEIAKKFTKMDFSNPMGWTGYYDTELKELSQAIETVLNMLKEKDELYHKALGDLVKADRENIQLKKQINFMANFINDNTPYTKDTKELENEEGIRTANFTVKYFERKSEE